MTQGFDRPCPCGEASGSSSRLNEKMGVFRCRRCGLLARVAMPSSEELAQWYREAYWTCYREEQTGPQRNNVYLGVLDWLDRFMLRPGTLIDVGCGGGALLRLCRSRHWRAIGFDASVEAVSYARALGLEAHACQWPASGLTDETADAVTLINVLDHLLDPFGALREARRILRPRGLLYVRVPNGPIHIRLMPLLSLVGLKDLPVFHLFGFGREAFLYHLPRLGFEVIALRAAAPSRGEVYPQPVGKRGFFMRVPRIAGAAVHRLLAGAGLDRKGWGLSIEVMARRGRTP